MKPCKRILFILLTALLLALALSPFTAAQAATDPCAGGHDWSGWQGSEAKCDTAGFRERVCYRCKTRESQTPPALGHSWNGGAVTAQPSCTSGGTRVYTCTRCGETRTESIGALGHSYGGIQVAKPSTCSTMGESFQVCSRCGDRVTHVMPKNENHRWDEGVITREPEGFTPGEKTYTCTLCGATRTEEVEPVSTLFNNLNMSLRNIPPSSGNAAADRLRIVTQPEGGTIPHGGIKALSVEAAGGEEPYDYEWWYEPEMLQLGMGISPSALADLVYGQGQAAADAIQQNWNTLKPVVINSVAEWFRNHNLSESMIAELTEKPAVEATQQESVPFNPLAKRIGSFTTPEINASKPGIYWCVVYDHNRQHVTSNRVKMTDALYIAEQPESKNIWGLGSVTLTCRAAGGSGNYICTWYGSEGIAGNALSNEAAFPADQVGIYHCFVLDYETGETVDSNTVRVYSDEATQADLRPVITTQPAGITLEYREDGQYSWKMNCEAVAYDGDNQHLRYTWSGKMDTGWAPITESQVLSRSYDHGIFRCRVEDTRTGQYVNSEEVKVQVKLKVAEINVRYDISETQNGTGRCLLDALIVGGAPQYEILVFCGTEQETQYLGTDNEIHTERVSYSNTLLSLNSDTGVLKNRFLQWGNCYYNNYGNRDWDAMTKPQNGAALRNLRLYQFYLRVRDSEGQEALSEIVEAPAKGKNYDEYGGSDAKITFE